MNEAPKVTVAQIAEQLPKAIAPTHETVGKPCEEYGLRHLKFSCPRCHVPWAICMAGQHHCHCGAVIQVNEPA